MVKRKKSKEGNGLIEVVFNTTLRDGRALSFLYSV